MANCFTFSPSRAIPFALRGKDPVGDRIRPIVSATRRLHGEPENSTTCAYSQHSRTIPRRRQIELGCPARKTRTKVEDLALLHSNLKRTALKDGLPDEEAEARADSQLGDIFAQADEIVMDHRAHSWWGRHLILGYIIVPIETLSPAFFLTVLLMVGASALFSMNQNQWQTLFNNAKSAQ